MSTSILHHNSDLRVTRSSSLAEPACDKRLRVEEFVRNLTQRSARTWSLDGVAEELNISRRHFTDLFRQVTGTTWANYLRRLRVKRAQRLLSETRHSVTAIALESGFDDLSSFYRAFHSVVGTAPHRWRNRHRERAKIA